jgi:hypothetical protein
MGVNNSLPGYKNILLKLHPNILARLEQRALMDGCRRIDICRQAFAYYLAFRDRIDPVVQSATEKIDTELETARMDW